MDEATLFTLSLSCSFISSILALLVLKSKKF